MAENYRYRAELPEVVRFVHRREALAALGSCGIELAADAGWHDICELSQETTGCNTSLATLEYQGSVTFDGLLDKPDWRLRFSKPTAESVITCRSGANFDDIHRHVHIGAQRDNQMAEVLLMTDTPPVSYDLRASVKATRHVDGLNDGILLARMQSTARNAPRYIDEDTAQSLTEALLNDESWPIYWPRAER